MIGGQAASANYQASEAQSLGQDSNTVHEVCLHQHTLKSQITSSSRAATRIQHTVYTHAISQPSLISKSIHRSYFTVTEKVSSVVRRVRLRCLCLHPRLHFAVRGSCVYLPYVLWVAQ